MADKKPQWKNMSEYIEESKAKVTPGVIPAKLSKEQMEEVQLKNERARNPKEFDAAKALYDSAVGKKKGGTVKKCKCMARGGGIEVRGKTRGRMV